MSNLSAEPKFLFCLHFFFLARKQENHRFREYPKLEGTYKGHRVQLLIILFYSLLAEEQTQLEGF